MIGESSQNVPFLSEWTENTYISRACFLSNGMISINTGGYPQLIDITRLGLDSDAKQGPNGV